MRAYCYKVETSEYERGKSDGRMEVVEWIRARDHGGGSSVQVAFWEWQAKLKEWGIEDKKK